MKLRKFLKDNIILSDGAMGTYFMEKTKGILPYCEIGNIEMPHIVKQIHREYIEAGSMLIKTNTFAANTFSLDCSIEKVREIIKRGIELARQSCENHDIFIAADIGPIPEINKEKANDKYAVINEYISIIDTFIEEGLDIFLFETFGSTDYIFELSSYIKSINHDAFVLSSFAVQPDGYSRKGIKIDSLLHEVKKSEDIDGFGLNCGCGAAHLIKLSSELNLSGKIFSIMPNAGYPEIVNNRMVYNSNSEYFANKVSEAVSLGYKIIGGCCGTSPEHIRLLRKSIEKKIFNESHMKPSYVINKENMDISANAFRNKLNSGKFVIACEIDPPFDTNVKKGIESARYLKAAGVDLITVADSPMARPRMDSIAFAAKIYREVGIDTMPHIACRDRNVNSLKSSILAAHMEGIRNILAVTGDTIPEGDRTYIKPVFNLSSVQLIELISNLNENMFSEDKIYIGGAANLNVLNKDAEVTRMIKKVQMGASFFLTQPLYSKQSVEYIKILKEKLPEGTKILAGIMPIISYRNALFLANEIPGITIPKEYINLFSPDMTPEKAEETGVQLAVSIIEKIVDYVDGLYLISPFNRVSLVPQILQKINYKC